MAQVSLFSSPLLLGFEHFEEIVGQITKKSNDGYPPYNIEQVSGGRLRITLAVAGFHENALSVEVNNNQLEIGGRNLDEHDSRAFLHRGIATRQFKRTFVLAEGIEVIGAELENGLLEIELVRPEPEPRVRTVAIKTGDRNQSRRISIEPEANNISDKAVE